MRQEANGFDKGELHLVAIMTNRSQHCVCVQDRLPSLVKLVKVGSSGQECLAIAFGAVGKVLDSFADQSLVRHAKSFKF